VKSIVAIFIGAGFGALLRWWLGLTLNSYFPVVPPGTLAANLIGGYLIGLAVAFFATATAIAPEWRLFVITGFCGGLTTSRRSPRRLLLCCSRAALWRRAAKRRPTW
jgi:CrcB protein